MLTLQVALNYFAQLWLKKEAGHRTFQVRQNLSSTPEPLEYDCFT